MYNEINSSTLISPSLSSMIQGESFPINNFTESLIMKKNENFNLKFFDVKNCAFISEMRLQYELRPDIQLSTYN